MPDSASSQPLAPRPPKRPVRADKFGIVIDDDYAWLRNRDWFNLLRTPERMDPEIRAHIEAENAYCDAQLAEMLPLRAELVREMDARLGDDDSAPADVDGGFSYVTRLTPGAHHASFFRRPIAGGDEQLVLDVEAEAEGKAYYRLSDFSDPTPSPDHTLFAWAADEAGDQHFRIYVKNIVTGALASSVVEHGFGYFAFSPDSQWLYWVYRDPVSRPTKVFRRPAMGGEDVLVYEQTEPGYFLAVERAASNGYVFIRVFSGTASEIWLIPAGDPTAAPRLVEPRQPGVIYELEHWNDHFVVRTNADGAVNYKLMVADEAAPGRAGWREWIAHRPDRYVTQVRAYRDHLVRLEWADANLRLVINTKDGRERELTEAEPAYDLTPVVRSYDAKAVRYVYQSPATPPRWIDYDVASGVRTVVADRTPAGYDATKYEVRRLTAEAADGQSVPITVLMRRGATLDGTAPLYLYAYGSYGYSIMPDFTPGNLSLVDRGWVTAIAHIRGGGERGPDWFDQARTTGKKLSITDFIACAEHLIAEGYTGPRRIVSHSFSAGGIVIGGSANLRPELWAGVINQVPFVDVLNSTQDTLNPLWPSGRPLWGDPAKADEYAYIASYSPYENVRPGPYPAALATAGLLDNRVGYWEAAKWVARVRENTTSGLPVLLKVNMTAGHQGHAGRQAELEIAAFYRAFCVWAVRRAAELA